MSIYPGSRPSRLVAVSWADRLDAARNEFEVLEVARDFLATFSPYDLARLPEAYRPGRLVDANDINEYAFMLLKQPPEDGAARGIYRLRRFFTQASVRLSALMSAPPPDLPVHANERRQSP